MHRRQVRWLSLRQEELPRALNEGKVQRLVGSPSALAAPVTADMHALCGFDYRSDAAWEQARAGALSFLPPDLHVALSLWRFAAKRDNF